MCSLNNTPIWLISMIYYSCVMRIEGLTRKHLVATCHAAPFLMVWDWWVSRAGPCHFISLAARSIFVSCCFPFLFFYSMGWCFPVRGLRTDRVLIALSQPCITNLFLIIIIIWYKTQVTFSWKSRKATIFEKKTYLSLSLNIN